MNVELEEFYKSNGWTIKCEGPLEIRHEDGSFATLRVAQDILDGMDASGKLKTISDIKSKMLAWETRVLSWSNDTPTPSYTTKESAAVNYHWGFGAGMCDMAKEAVEYIRMIKELKELE